MRFSVRTCVIVLGLGWGCSEVPIEPSIDPTELRADLTVVRTVFAAPVVRSAGFFFGVPASPPPGGPLIPDSLLGKTLTWNCATQSYEVSAETGAPANGVRLRLYQLAANGPIACPTIAIGYLDLLDVSAGGTRAARVTATGPAGGVGYRFVDYTITRELADSTRSWSASGFVSDGHERVVFELTSAFNSETFNSVSTTQLDDPARDFHATLEESAQMGVDTYYDTVDLILRKADLTLELKGSNGWANTFQSWDEVVTVNRGVFARVQGQLSRSDPTITPPRLTNEERQLVLDVVHTPGVLRSDLGRVLAVAQRLVNAR